MKILVTGSAGFIGTNIVKTYAKEHTVIGIDNLSRKYTWENRDWLDKLPYHFILGDITTYNFDQLPPVDVIFHMAAQVGVQKSIDDPLYDLDQNIIGTIKVLEYARMMKEKPVVIFASTNKVYGKLKRPNPMEHINMIESPIDENTPLDFQTPYGVSKGAADQYILDYSRQYGIKGVVFRQSCIYGYHQKGSEEQGWISWFLRADKEKLPITIYGNGNQRRDVLFVDDLIAAYDKCFEDERTWGQVFNMGGGPENTLSLHELIQLAKITTEVNYADWRPSDQKIYISDITKFSELTRWKPLIGVSEGLNLMKKEL